MWRGGNAEYDQFCNCTLPHLGLRAPGEVGPTDVRLTSAIQAVTSEYKEMRGRFPLRFHPSHNYKLLAAYLECVIVQTFITAANNFFLA
jgi:hypothetical protein